MCQLGAWDTVGVEEWADSGADPELAVAGVCSQGSGTGR